MNVKRQEIKDLDNLEPIDYGVVAKPHKPIYKMHRYFARRPYTVFRELIEYYSNPGSIVLDPMCGGGVTIVEGLRLGRKVIGVDLNPLSIFITRCEVMDANLDKLRAAFEEVRDKVADEINRLYLTKCPKCGKESPAEWFEWSNVFRCDNCYNRIIVANAKKIGSGRYECDKCGSAFVPSKSERMSPKLMLAEVLCPSCKLRLQKETEMSDFEKAEEIEINLDNICKKEKLEYPKDAIPPCNLDRESALFDKGITHYFKMFTSRNLLGCALLKSAIKDIIDTNAKDLMLMTFSSCLSWVNKMCYRKKGKPVAWGRHDFWPPEVWVELNVWKCFLNRYKATLNGKKESKNEISKVEIYDSLSSKFLEDKKNVRKAILLTKSATHLPLPDNCIDAIITDPPYGGNVNYIELSNFYAVWLKDRLGIRGLIDKEEEAVADRHTDFKGAKTLKQYRDLMLKIFQECYRVIKPNRWLVMTFHNREFKIWSSIHLASHDAGFIWSERDGMIYQPPIRAYTTAVYLKRKGSMLGDFILSYKKGEKIPQKKWIEDAEIANKIRKLAHESIGYHGGARLFTIYNRVMPFLLNSGLLDKVKEKELETYLKRYFVKKDEKWYFREHIDEKGELVKRKEEFPPVKRRLESIIRRYLYKVRKATIDEILGEVYSRLINSNAAEYEEIDDVLSKICILSKGRFWHLKEERAGELLLPFMVEGKGKVKYSEESDHDIIIERLVKLGQKKYFDSHVGTTEQKKDKEFKKMSIPMGSNVQYGLSDIAFERIKEIDVLWIKRRTINAAFEVEMTTSIDSGINRFRELFAATPTLNIPAYIVIPSKRQREARRRIGSLANRTEGVTERIKYILYSDIIKANDKSIEEISREVK